MPGNLMIASAIEMAGIELMSDKSMNSATSGLARFDARESAKLRR